jgi:hypothetical protein
MTAGGVATSVLTALAWLWPESPTVSDDLARAVAFLDWAVDPADVVAAGYAAAGCTVALAFPVLWLAPVPTAAAGARPDVLALVAALALAVAHAVHALPRFLARLRRTAALGEAPDLVARAALRLHVEPTVEAAVAFAVDTGQGPLAAALEDRARRAAGRPGSGLEQFGRDWAEWFPALRRSTGLLVAAADAPDGERARTLERALDAVLDGTHDRMAAYAARVGGPATAIYAFGVLVPLALVAVLPAARVAGLPVSLPLLALVYDGMLPLGLLAAAAWLLARRPVAFPPPAVDRDHPAVPDRRWPTLLAAALPLGVAWGLRGTTLDWAVPLVAVGGSAGAALVVHLRPVVAVHEHVRDVESGLADAAYLVGSAVREGDAVERALATAADEVGGATGDVLADAVATGERLRVDVHTAFLGPDGALADVPSPRVRSTAALFAIAGREGRPAGRALVAMAGHLDDLATVERETRRELARVTGTLRSTALAFGPVVAGATVAMAGRTGGGAFGSDPYPVGTLGVVVGAYVLVLAALLAGLAAGLTVGLDRTVVGYRVGQALLAATTTYPVAFVATGTLL